MRWAAVLVKLPLTGYGGSTVNGPNPGNPSALTVASPDLEAGSFPREFTCDGANRRPRLQWSTPPAGTQELAIELLDPDAPGGTFTHWLAYGIPPGLSSLAAVPAGAAEGVRQRLRPPRLRRPVPGAPLPLRGPRAGHPAGPGHRGGTARPGGTHQRPRARQGRTGRHLPARLTGHRQRAHTRGWSHHAGRATPEEAGQRKLSWSFARPIWTASPAWRVPSSSKTASRSLSSFWRTLRSGRAPYSGS